MQRRFSQASGFRGFACMVALAAMPVCAQVQNFHASWEESVWRLDARPGVCALVHEIPRFGQARFEQRSGRRLGFSLHADEPPVRDQQARIVAEAPPWKHQGEARPLGDFRLQQGKTPMRLPRDQALRIYYELEQGMKAVIEFSDWGDGRDQVQVALSPVRFRESLPGFLNCTASLLYLDFEPLDEKTVYFGTGSDRLSRTTRQALEEVARAWRKQHDFRIVLGGHADARGTPEYNMQLSRKRATMVARYLASRGVPSKVVESRYFGETQPLVAANSQAAWARNRRVTIWLAVKP
ncbi:MAG: OmpA family protein [Thiogranum sp.]|jgi:sodium-type flagellar protein MotY|nr:OmpA family protein [Thiogranum sp.]